MAHGILTGKKGIISGVNSDENPIALKTALAVVAEGGASFDERPIAMRMVNQRILAETLQCLRSRRRNIGRRPRKSLYPSQWTY
jgi:hypothetical protein